MSDALPFELLGDAAETGFRLHTLELFNWGTFDKRIVRLEPHGQNSLVTGDIGSGKSTLVDAVTTLLVPAHRVAYNKAAGADNKERTLRSYVLGHYKSERLDSHGGTSKPVALRDESAFSVILGVFRNSAFGETVTLAQVFWIKDAVGTPGRLFVGSDRALSIAEHFTGFGSEVAGLRKRLRVIGAEVHDGFPPYGAWFKRRLGIGSDQALDLFHQTVSMKSVGNLTDFVRHHMLDAAGAGERIDALLGHFDDLNRAHEAVLRAKRQMEMLGPIVAESDRYDALTIERDEHEAVRNALRFCFAELRRALIDEQLTTLDARRTRLEVRNSTANAERRATSDRRDHLRAALAANGGDRLASIDAEIADLSAQRDRRRRRADTFAELCAATDLDVPTNSGEFHTALSAAAERSDRLAGQEAAHANEQTELEVAFRQFRQQREELESELRSLRSRTSNIPRDQVELRLRLAGALSLDPEALPFAGELLRIRDGEHAWEPAAERILRSFALAVLVADEHYADVQSWVDQTDLRGRFVYFRVRNDARVRDVGGSLPAPDTLAAKTEVHPAGRWRPWLTSELNRRFDYVCCESPEQFRRERRALTRAGQTKGGDDRHEKDDRHRLGDRTRYVLGWSNADKIAALETQQREVEDRLGALGARIGELAAARAQLAAQRDGLVRVSTHDDWSELDWQTSSLLIAQCDDERRRLTEASNVLEQLQNELAANGRDLAAIEQRIDELRHDMARLDTSAERFRVEREEQNESLAMDDAAVHLEKAPDVAALRDVLNKGALTLASIQADERDLRDHLQGLIDAAVKNIQRSAERIVRDMQAFAAEFPVETQELDVAVQSADGYRMLLRGIAADDLPQFESRFKQLLNENTINEVLHFHTWLNRQREEITERIASINASLLNIDYNDGTYIRLESAEGDDSEVRDFRRDLRACLDDSLSGVDGAQYAETKFLNVKALIDRFRGRDGMSELDRRWTAKVTDVRNWFGFAASERYRTDDTEREHYSDSSGKSGGQKEKLAYTVLAASLAYQFGLEWGAAKSRTFRFVVIDEAFGRGSDDSARYGLHLFERLNLQLLVVTPLQKIHVIEPFVRTVGFVQNVHGKESTLRNLTIEEYHDEKRARRAITETTTDTASIAAE